MCECECVCVCGGGWGGGDGQEGSSRRASGLIKIAAAWRPPTPKRQQAPPPPSPPRGRHAPALTTAMSGSTSCVPATPSASLAGDSMRLASRTSSQAVWAAASQVWRSPASSNAGGGGQQRLGDESHEGDINQRQAGSQHVSRVALGLLCVPRGAARTLDQQGGHRRQCTLSQQELGGTAARLHRGRGRGRGCLLGEVGADGALFLVRQASRRLVLAEAGRQAPASCGRAPGGRAAPPAVSPAG